MCQQMKEFVNGVEVTNNLQSIKYGDNVTFIAYYPNIGAPIKTINFQLLINGLVVETVPEQATLVNGIWSAVYSRAINFYGSYRVHVVGATQ